MCKIQTFDPFDKTLVKFYKKIESKFECNGFPSFIIANAGNTLTVNKSLLLANHQAEERDIDCIYRAIECGGTDYVRLSQWRSIKFNRSIADQFLYIECTKNGTLILDDLVAFPPNKSDIDDKEPKPTYNNKIETKLNVLLIGIDSVSRLNSIRHLPKTRKFLEGLNAIELRVYNKVGENSFPNLLALLTGIKASSFNMSIFYDDIDFIWKSYSEKGYHTLFMEDMTFASTFNSYGANGFKRKPVEYYFFHLARIMEEFKSKFFEKKTYCFRDKLILEFFWDYIKLLPGSKFEPYFAYTFMSHLSHTIMNYAGYLDAPALDLFKHLSNSGGLQNTVLFFFSDHGIRYGGLRKTYMGHLESNTPMAFLVFPSWFYNKYPSFYQHLKTNQDRLSTHFDVHQTFRHIISLYTNESYISNNPYGQSLFDAIPTSRTCQDVGVDTLMCSCNDFYYVNTTEPLIQKAAIAILTQINALLEPVSDLCHPLKLGEIVSSKAHVTKKTTFLLIIVKTVPGNALFEAIANVDTKTESTFIEDGINRINAYKNTSICVAQTIYVTYCFCK